MSADDCLQPEEDTDQFLYKDERQHSADPVIFWGPNKDISNFLQQTLNCLHVCEMVIKFGFAKLPSATIQAKWDLIATSHENNRSLSSNFIQTQDYEIKAKSMESQQLTSQQFWMFHRVDRKEIYIVFSSQETSAYILSEANVWMMPKQKDIATVDNIPISMFKGLLLQDYNLILTGHSLGGAIAILATYKLLMKDLNVAQIGKIRCITFGAPQVSYENLEQIINTCIDKVIFRYELPEDPVLQLLTAFQRAENPHQEFLVNLMNLLGIQNSFKYTKDMEIGQQDFLQISKSHVDEIQQQQKSGQFGTVFVPQNREVSLPPAGVIIQYYVAHHQDWSFFQNLKIDGNQQQAQIYLLEFMEQLRKQHQFERYLQELFHKRISKIVDLPEVGVELVTGDLVQCRLPDSDRWNKHTNQVQALFDEKFTKVIITSKQPHVLGIRSSKIQQYPKWGIVAPKILQDRGEFKIMFVFYSADNYKNLQKNNLIKMKLYGCFDIVENIEIKATQSCGEDASEIRNSAYKNIQLQQLYTSAFQACLFKGEGHNPMLQSKNQSENNRNAVLQEDRDTLVEILGSLIVNQECLQIILKENQRQYQNILAKSKQFNECDTKILQDLEATGSKSEIQQTLVELAKTKLNKIYQKFKFDLKQYTQTSSTNNEHSDAKECVTNNKHSDEKECVTNNKHTDEKKCVTNNKHSDAKECVSESIPVLFSLSSSLIWQMKMFLWSQTILFRIAGYGAQYLGGGAGVGIAALGIGEGALLSEILLAASVVGVGVGGFIFSAIGALSSTYAFFKTRSQYDSFFNNSEEMQRSYKLLLEDFLKLFGYELKEEHSTAGLEIKLTRFVQVLLRQDEIRYDYNNSEKELNQKIYEYIIRTETSQEPQDEETKEETELLKLINRKIDCLSRNHIFKNHKKNIQLVPSRGLSALLVFVWNNYRIRSCLSKTWRIGIMGSKKAGKSTLAKLLGCTIEKTGDTESTEDATLYQNVPTNGFCVVDFPHLNNIEGNNTMKVFYSLSDITIIVMKSQYRAKEDQQNLEAGEIIKSIEKKYSQLGYENTDRKFPILVLFNQVDRMIFDDQGDNPNDLTLSQKFQKLKTEIINILQKKYSIDEKKILVLFSSLKPELPKPTKEKIREWTLLLQKQLINQKISTEEFIQKQEEFLEKGNSADKKRLQDVTGCSFFSWQKDHQENPQSIVSTLAKMVLDLGDEEGANALVKFFKAEPYGV